MRLKALIAAALIAACPVPASATEWWSTTRGSKSDTTWRCVPSAQTPFSSPAEALYSHLSEGFKIVEFGDDLVGVCSPNVCYAVATSREACESIGGAMNQLMGKYQ